MYKHIHTTLKPFQETTEKPIMEILYSIFTFLWISLFLVFLAISFFFLRIFAGKSITDPEYPPVKGTVFNILFHYSKMYDYLTQFACKYSTFRLLAPEQSEVFTTDQRNIEHILKTRFDNYSKGHTTRDMLTDVFGQGLFISDGERWSKQRRLASFEFSTRYLRDFSSSVFRENAAKLVRVVSGFSNEGQAFDMQDLLMRWALKSIVKVGFGIELNCWDRSNKEAIAFMTAFDDVIAVLSWRFVDPFWKLKRFLNLGSEASLRKSIELIDESVYQLIRKKRTLLAERQECNDKEDILSRFLIESEKDPEQMNDKYVRDMVLSFLLAGKDTSANTLSWFLYMMCKNPVVQEIVAQEVRGVIGAEVNEANVDDFVANITEETLEQVHYLHAALTETLRLYPAVPLDGRSADVDDILPCGFKVKKGDNVHYVTYAMARIPHIWGQDCEDFRPERWLKDGIFQPESPFKFTSFHAGPRICLGKEFAYRQMKIASMALLHFFRFKLADETKPVNYKQRSPSTLTMPSFYVRFQGEPRKKSKM